MGIVKAKIPKIPKVFVCPAYVVLTPADLKLSEALSVRAGRPTCLPNSFPCSIEGRAPVELIDQAEPNTSFHPVFQGLQHALRPHRTFHPTPLVRGGVSCLLSPLGHYRRSVFVHCGLHASTSLRPFAPGVLPPFPAPMDALTPTRPLHAPASQSHERPFTGQVSLVHTTLPSMHSVTTHLTCPTIASSLPAQRGGLPGLTLLLGPLPAAGFCHPLARVHLRSGLRLESAGSSHRTAESCSLSYGLHVRLRLLPTPPRGDAVTFGYRERASPGRGLSPLRLRLLPGARIPAFAGMTVELDFPPLREITSR
jgi:hypothetical protein